MKRMLVVLGIIGVMLSTGITYMVKPWSNLAYREVNPTITRHGVVGLLVSTIISTVLLALAVLVYSDDLPVTKMFLGIVSGVQIADGLNDALMISGVPSLIAISVSTVVAASIPLYIILRNRDGLSIALYTLYLLGLGRLAYTALSMVF